MLITTTDLLAEHWHCCSAPVEIYLQQCCHYLLDSSEDWNWILFHRGNIISFPYFTSVQNFLIQECFHLQKHMLSVSREKSCNVLCFIPMRCLNVHLPQWSVSVISTGFLRLVPRRLCSLYRLWNTLVPPDFWPDTFVWGNSAFVKKRCKHKVCLHVGSCYVQHDVYVTSGFDQFVMKKGPLQHQETVEE